MNDFENLFEKYKKELKEDLQLDEFNLKEKSMIVPTIKHKWVARLIQHKNNINKLNKQKYKLFQTIVEQLKKDKTIGYSEPTLEKQARKHSKVKEFDQYIKQEEQVIEYLEKIEKILTSLTWDMKNLIELQKLETL